MSHDPISVLFVCLGNICRSPLAEAVFRQEVADSGLEQRFRIDSAGTSGYHDGEPPDSRTAAVAARRGVTVTGSSRRVVPDDFHQYDYLVAMDRENHQALEAMTDQLGLDGAGPVLLLLREFDPEADGDLEVPDPYFGGRDGFDRVHDLVERSAQGFLEHIRESHQL